MDTHAQRKTNQPQTEANSECLVYKKYGHFWVVLSMPFIYLFQSLALLVKRDFINYFASSLGSFVNVCRHCRAGHAAPYKPSLTPVRNMRISPQIVFHGVLSWLALQAAGQDCVLDNIQVQQNFPHEQVSHTQPAKRIFRNSTVPVCTCTCAVSPF